MNVKIITASSSRTQVNAPSNGMLRFGDGVKTTLASSIVEQTDFKGPI